MNERKRAIIRKLYHMGERGTANAIVDALEMAARARRMLRRSVKAIHTSTDPDEIYALEACIDMLRALLNGDD